MQVVRIESIRVVELVDGLRFRLFALYNHDIREYELVSKFTVTKAVSAMVSISNMPPIFYATDASRRELIRDKQAQVIANSGHEDMIVSIAGDLQVQE
jgi:hypothetical protein